MSLLKEVFAAALITTTLTNTSFASGAPDEEKKTARNMRAVLKSTLGAVTLQQSGDDLEARTKTLLVTLKQTGDRSVPVTFNATDLSSKEGRESLSKEIALKVTDALDDPHAGPASSQRSSQ